MKEAIQSIAEMLKEAEGDVDARTVLIMMNDTLAALAVQVEEQDGEIARLRQTVEVLAKGGKPVMGGPSGGGGPFSIG